MWHGAVEVVLVMAIALVTAALGLSAIVVPRFGRSWFVLSLGIVMGVLIAIGFALLTGATSAVKAIKMSAKLAGGTLTTLESAA